MKLYTFALSPNCQKVLAVARELHIALDRVHVDIFKGESKTPAYLAKNPNGRVPLLEDDGLVLSESNAILVYLAGERSAPSLFPAARRERAEVLRWLFWQSAHLAPAVRKVAIDKVVKPIAHKGKADPAAVAAGSAELETLAKVLDDRLAGRKYMTGELSIADFALVPFIGIAMTCGLDVMAYPHLCAWSEQMTSRESVRHTMAEVRAAGLCYAGVAT